MSNLVSFLDMMGQNLSPSSSDTAALLNLMRGETQGSPFTFRFLGSHEEPQNRRRDRDPLPSVRNLESSADSGNSSNVGRLYQGGVLPSEWVQREQQRVDIGTVGNATASPLPVVVSFEAKEAERLRLQGNTAFQARQYKEAVELYTHSIHFNPDSALTYSNRSFAHLKLGNVVEAVADAEGAVNLNPHSFKCYFRLGSALEARGDFRRALDSYRRAAALNTKESEKTQIEMAIAKCESKLKRGVAGTKLLSDGSASYSGIYNDKEEGPLNFSDLLDLAKKGLETRRQVTSYRSMYETQNELVEYRQRFKRVRELVQITTNTPLTALVSQAKEKQAALRRMLKSDQRDTYTSVKKDRDSSFQKLWSAAEALDKAIRELERIAKEEEAYYERYGSTSSTSGRVEELDGDEENESSLVAESMSKEKGDREATGKDGMSNASQSDNRLGDPERLASVLHRRREIEDEVHKLQQRLAITEEAGRQFFLALLNEERMVEKLQPLLSEAQVLHEEIERETSYTARHASRELSQKRLSNLLSLRSAVDEVQKDRQSFTSSLEEGNKLLEQEAVLERDRLALERQRIQLKGEIEWMRVCDESQSKINQLENSVDLLQRKIEVARESQQRIQKRILVLIEGDHPELAYTSMLSGSRILRLVKGSGLWLNITLSDIQFVKRLSNTNSCKLYRALFRGETVSVREIAIDNDRALRHFRTEISLVARCRHPNVITIKGVFFDGGQAYIIFPFFLRGSLKDLCARKETLSSVELQDIFRQVVSGLAYLHEQGIIHANLSPSTIFLSEPNRPVITEFGIAELSPNIASSCASHESEELGESVLSILSPNPSSFPADRAPSLECHNVSQDAAEGNPTTPPAPVGGATEAGSGHAEYPCSPDFRSSSAFSADLTEIQAYLAPELLSGHWHPSCASDVWALGRTLFEVASNNACLLDPSVGHYSLPHLMPSQTRIEIPSKRVGGDEELADMISSTLMYDPHQRPTAYELLAHPYLSASLNSHPLNRMTALVNSDGRIEAVRSYIYAIRRELSKVLISVQRSQMVESVAAVFPGLSESSMISPIMVVFQGEAGVDEGALTTEMLNLYYEQLVVRHRAMVAATTEDSDNSSVSESPTSPPSSPSASSEDSKKMESAPPARRFPLARHTSMSNRELASFPLSSSPSAASAPTSIMAGVTYLPAEDESNIDASVFELLGKMMVKNVVENRPLPLELNASILKYFCGASVSILDLEEYDRTFARHLKQLRLLSNDSLRATYLDFSSFPPDFLASQYDGIYSTTTQLQSSNVGDYVKMSVEYFLIYKRQRGLEAMKKGFYHYPSLSSHLKLLTPFDLQILLSGMQHINAQVIIDSLVFKNFPSTSKTPEHLKELIGKMTQNNLRRFLQFCTSTAGIPVTGEMKKITVVHCIDKSRLPVGHGCVSQLDLPDYNNPKELEEKLLIALAHVTDGFHII